MVDRNKPIHFWGWRVRAGVIYRNAMRAMRKAKKEMLNER
jgi:hypothetical protein